MKTFTKDRQEIFVDRMLRFRRHTFIFTAVAAVLVLLIYAVKVYHHDGNSDFEVYYKAANHMAHGNWDLVYSLADGKSPFRYAPVLLPFFRILALFGYKAAQLAWFLLQYLAFGLAYYFIYLSLKRTRTDAAWATCLVVIFTLRFCLDSFTIGQVASLILLAWSITLWAWMEDRPAISGIAQLLPAILKIGPGFTYLYFLVSSARECVRAIGAALLVFLGLGALSTLWIGPWERNRMLWESWLLIVKSDGAYIDSSHYGSQSVLSALLRMAKLGWLDLSQAHSFSMVISLIICVSVVAFWAFRKPLGARGRGLFLSISVFPYIWVMPQTFKYSLHLIAIPLSFLLAQPNRRLTRVALAVAFLVYSVAGKDIIGDTLFFANQKASVPLLASFVVAAAVFSEAFRASENRLKARVVEDVKTAQTSV